MSRGSQALILEPELLRNGIWFEVMAMVGSHIREREENL